MKLKLIIIGIVLVVASIYLNQYYMDHATMSDIFMGYMAMGMGIHDPSMLSYLPLLSKICLWFGIGCFFFGLVIDN